MKESLCAHMLDHVKFLIKALATFLKCPSPLLVPRKLPTETHMEQSETNREFDTFHGLEHV